MSQAAVSIKSEQKSQIDAVHAVIKAAFKQENEVDLVKQLRDAKTYIPELSMVALVDDKVVGHAMLSPAFIEKADSERIAMTAPVDAIAKSARAAPAIQLERGGLRVDLGQRQLLLEEERLDYDQLVLATGARHSYFGHDAWEATATCKTALDALNRKYG